MTELLDFVKSRVALLEIARDQVNVASTATRSKSKNVSKVTQPRKEEIDFTSQGPHIQHLHSLPLARVKHAHVVPNLMH